MVSKRSFFGVNLMVVALALTIVSAALLVFLPLPEEQVFDTLSNVQIKSIRLENASIEAAVAEVNSQLEKRGDTRLRLSVSDAHVQMAAATISLELEDVPVALLARYLSELSVGTMYGTRDGIVIDMLRCEAPSNRRPGQSWRRPLRDWVRYTLPSKWDRFWTWVGDIFTPAPPPPADPFAPLPP